MGEEFYSTIKLITGEEIFSLISIDDNDGDPIIILQNPVIIKIINNHNGIFFKVKSWLEIPEDDIFIIKMDKVITMSEVREKTIIQVYKKFLDDESSEFDEEEIDSTGRVKLTDKMGYVASVKDSRKFLENLFKGIKES